MRKPIESLLTRDRAAKAPAAAELSPAQQRKLLGRYRAATQRFIGNTFAPEKAREMEVVLEENELVTVISGKRRRLVPVTESLFRREKHTRATIAFVEDDDARYLQGDFGNFVKVAE